MNVRTNGSDAMYYVHTDHLGSLNSIYTATGTKIAEQSFDAWGRKRNPTNWLYTSIATPPAWLIRGYTGHEHLPQFGLINMNARLYEPLLAHVVSPDNYVQAPDFTQSYNRYSYCINNPLKYTDPSGNEPEDWYRNSIGEVEYDSEIHSQEDLDSRGISGTYIGQTAQWFTESGTFANGDINGNITESVLTFPAVTITAMQSQGNRGDDFLTTASNTAYLGSTLAQIAANRTASDLKYAKYATRGVDLVKDAAYMTRLARNIGVGGAVLGTGISTYKIVTNQASGIDYLDAGIGGAAIYGAIFLQATPIGWAIDVGAGLYFAGRLTYDAYQEFNKK
jgi:RHS repeat-associated protein